MMMRLGTLGDARLVKVFRSFLVELVGRLKHGVMRAGAFGTGRAEHQQSRQLRSHLAQVFEILAGFEDIGGSVVV